MARKKTITKEQILKAAYEVVATEGFSRFTARNIAAKMGCSTQPIYLEFKNMNDLKEALLDQLYAYLADEVFMVEHTRQPLIDLALNYIHFAEREKQLYRALYLEESGFGNKMQAFSNNLFAELASKDPSYENLSPEQIQSLNMGCWVVATGIASLMSSAIIKPTDEQIISLMQLTIDNILKDDVRIDLD